MAEDEVADMSANMVEDDENFGGFYEKGPNAGAMYLQIFDGSICQRSKHEIDGWEGPIETKNQTTGEKVFSWVRRYDRVICRIVDVNKEKKTFDSGGKVTNYSLTLMAGGKKGVLRMQYMDAVLKRFMKVSPNIDFDKFILISAWSTTRNGKRKQAVSFRQGEGRDVDKWVKVPEYWDGPRDKEGMLTGPATGADGTVLPKGIQDEDDESWDYKAQNKFLSAYFRDHVLEKIKAISVQFESVPVSSNEESLGEPKPVVAYDETKRPDDPLAQNLADGMTGEQVTKVRELCGIVKLETEAVSQKILGTGFHQLNQHAGAYLIYRLKKKYDKMVADGKITVPAAKPAEVEEDDDDWGIADTAAQPKAKAVGASDDEDDDSDIPF